MPTLLKTTILFAKALPLTKMQDYSDLLDSATFRLPKERHGNFFEMVELVVFQSLFSKNTLCPFFIFIILYS